MSVQSALDVQDPKLVNEMLLVALFEHLFARLLGSLLRRSVEPVSKARKIGTFARTGLHCRAAMLKWLQRLWCAVTCELQSDGVAPFPQVDLVVGL